AAGTLSNPPPPTARPPLSLHDALPIYRLAVRPIPVFQLDPMNSRILDRQRTRQSAHRRPDVRSAAHGGQERRTTLGKTGVVRQRSEEHTSELQSPDHIVCRLLLEKKNR